ncbi:MAG: hypothetical protein P8011_02545 [Acidihalobacter sp.]|uniref:hypothetical protein n=1 Tax=Acidihalobacter sp. TaxID=1872108 RepID=UPI00307DECFF
MAIPVAPGFEQRIRQRLEYRLLIAPGFLQFGVDQGQPPVVPALTQQKQRDAQQKKDTSGYQRQQPAPLRFEYRVFVFQR